MRESIEINSSKIILKQGNIVECKSEAIVNAANRFLKGGGGVDGAIHKAAGPKLLDELKQIIKDFYPKGLPAGKAVITKAYKLESKYIIHTVGPFWNNRDEEKDLLYDAYYNSLEVAFKHKLRSIAFPAISTGAYRFPKDIAGKIAFRAIINFLESHNFPKEVYIVLFDDITLSIFIDVMRNIDKDKNDRN